MAFNVAFLRGINLGKSRRVQSDALQAAFEEAGLGGAATFRASGNVIFEAASGSEGDLRAKAEAGLAGALGFEVVVFLRSATEVRAIATRGPFEARAVAAATGKLQVALLHEKPSAAVRRKALGMATEDDMLAIHGRELYWLPRGGTQESELDRQALERAVGEWTMRTMGTIEQIAARHCAG